MGQGIIYQIQNNLNKVTYAPLSEDRFKSFIEEFKLSDRHQGIRPDHSIHGGHSSLNPNGYDRWCYVIQDGSPLFIRKCYLGIMEGYSFACTIVRKGGADMKPNNFYLADPFTVMYEGVEIYKVTRPDAVAHITRLMMTR